MAEYTANATQLVASGDPVLFSDMTIRGNCRIMHREGSGLFTLIGPDTCPCKGMIVRITVGTNIALPADGTPGAISAALAINGEIDNSTRMTVTPAAVSEQFNVGRTVKVLVPGGSSVQISLDNASSVPIEFSNTTIDFERSGS